MVSIGGGGRVLIGDSVSVSAGSRIVSGMDEIDKIGLSGPCIPKEYRSIHRGRVIISDFSLLFTNSIIFPNVVIGEGAVIGAGSIVTKDIPPWTVAFGSPAEVKRDRKAKREDIIALYKRMCQEEAEC